MTRYEKEWPCCGDTTITDSWEPAICPFCPPFPSSELAVAVPSEREAFKAWMLANKRWINLAEYPSGMFVHTPTELMAEAWIAGRATPPSLPAAQADAFADLLRMLDTAITHGHTLAWQQERRELVARLKPQPDTP